MTNKDLKELARNSNEELHIQPVSETLSKFKLKNPEKSSSLDSIVEEFHESSFALSLIFFGLPIAIPLPYPPFFTTIMSIPLLFFTIQMILGFEKVHLPNFLANYKIRNNKLIFISEKTIPVLIRLESFLDKISIFTTKILNKIQSQTKINFGFTRNVFVEKLVGIVGIFCAIAIAIPLPMTNSIPAWGIVVMSLGLIRKDAFIIMMGILVSFIGLIVATIATIVSYHILVGMFYGIKLFFFKIISFLGF